MDIIAVVKFQSNWMEILASPFMRTALIAGILVAIASGLIGYFVIVRGSMFASHALAHIGFPGATGAALVGTSVLTGLVVFTVVGALAIGLLGKKANDREIATGTVLAFATGLGVLFASLASENTSTVTNILFGNLLAIPSSQLVVFAGFLAVLIVVLLVIFRPLLFASIDPPVAEAKGVPVKGLGITFMILLALVVSMAVTVVGVLLIFALLVTPAAAALRFTARPGWVIFWSSAIGVASVAVGLTIAAMINLPPSFFIVSTVFVIWLVAVATRREGRVQVPVGGHG
ncbi:MAG: metal ABC transporter permease [Actinobacteria bacterium]|nr:metal ABC transporter permease [Actinomycetota bacterium]